MEEVVKQTCDCLGDVVREYSMMTRGTRSDAWRRWPGSRSSNPAGAGPLHPRCLFSRSISVRTEITDGAGGELVPPRTAAITLARLAIAAVWLYEGLWAKILGGRTDQLAVAASLPVPDSFGRALLIVIGAIETLLAIWVLSGIQPRPAAGAQAALLVSMSATGLAFAGDAIPHPGEMVVMNLSFLALIVVVGLAGDRQ